MKRRDRDELRAAEALDAYLESLSRDDRGLGADQADPTIPQEVVDTVDLLQEEAQGVEADPAFVARLSDQLQARYGALHPTPRRIETPVRSCLSLLKRVAALATTEKRRSMLMRLSWGMTVAVAVVATLIAVVLLRPQALPAEQMLARAAAATMRSPDKVEHVVVETWLEVKDTESALEDYRYVQEDWRRLGATLDGHPATVEHATARYAVSDSLRTQPLSLAYETWSRRCFLDLATPADSATPAAPVDRAGGCVSVEDAVHISLPGLLDQVAETSPQAWIGRLQVNAEDLKKETSAFNGRQVTSWIEFRREMTLTLHLNVDSYVPVGFVAETRSYRLTQTVHLYEIVDPESLPYDPFAWPPYPVADMDAE